MRLVLIVSTGRWLVANVLAGAVGGTILESIIVAASVTTSARMTLAARGAAARDGAELEGAV